MKDEIDERASLSKLEANPKEDSPKEKSRIRAFFESIKPVLEKKGKLSAELTQVFGEARVKKEVGEAEKVSAEAAKIAEEADETRARKLALELDTIDKHFTSAGSHVVDKLKLAKYLQSDPGLQEALERVKDLEQELFWKYGTTVEIDPSGLQGHSVKYESIKFMDKSEAD